MDSFQSLVNNFRQTGLLHHAIAIEGEHEASLPVLRDFIEDELKMVFVGNPDVMSFATETLGIDQAREIRARQERKPARGGRQVIIVSVRACTSEAQNALLKVAEEPALGTHIFFLLPRMEALLPTLRSRLLICALPHGGGLRDLAGTFFAAPTLAERLLVVKPIIDAKDAGRAAAFVDGLILLFRDRDLLKTGQGAVAVGTELLECRAYLETRSSSIKLVLEHVAHVLGRV